VFVFFFQAEDGIRDIGVTGVQTCALPILHVNVHTHGVILWIQELETDWLVAFETALIGTIQLHSSSTHTHHCSTYHELHDRFVLSSFNIDIVQSVHDIVHV